MGFLLLFFFFKLGRFAGSNKCLNLSFISEISKAQALPFLIFPA